MFSKRALNHTMAIALVIAIVLLYVYDPVTACFSYHCPVKTLTGFDCPGCGGQRAVHALVHLRFREAVGYNPFLVITAVYISAVVMLRLLNGPRTEKIKKTAMSEPVAWIYLALMAIWTVVRNIFDLNSVL